MRLSVVIPTHQRPESLKKLLKSLADQDFAIEELEVYVVGNLEQDGGAEVVRNFVRSIPNIHWRVAGRIGVNAARNLGLQVSSAPVVLFLDDDCFALHRGYLRDVLAAHEEHTTETAIGGGYRHPANAKAADRAYAEVAAQWLAKKSEEDGRDVHLVGGNVSYKRAALAGLGLSFNEEIIFGGAESELHFRILAAGGKLLYFDHLSVGHDTQISFIQLLRKGYLQGLGAGRQSQSGLIHSARAAEKTYRPHGFERLCFAAYHSAFRAGLAFGRKFVARKPGALTAAGFFLQHAFGRLARRSLLRSPRRSFQTELPLSRFFFLPVAESCPQNCTYRSPLGCLSKGPIDISAELKKAKAYGFKEVLLPCNIHYLKDKHETVGAIHREGLKPVALVNGEAGLPLTTLEELSGRAGYHLLLAQTSTYQSTLIEYLKKTAPDFSVTYFHHHWRKGLRALRQLPAELRGRLHVLFPSSGDDRHPVPSGRDIHRFLRKSRLPMIRQAAGFWPVDRNQQAEPWPELDPMLEWNVGRSPHFSVVIPAFDSAVELPKVLRSLNRQTFAGEFEVIVVDDGSRDRTGEQMAAEVQNLRPKFSLRYFYWPRPAGRLQFRAGLARNFGVSRASGKYLCFLDSDILVPPGYLADLERLFENNDLIQAKREMLTAKASGEIDSYRPYDAGEAYRDTDYWENFKATDSWSALELHWKYTCTYALSLSRDLFLRAGGFSPRFSTYGFEDVDLGYRCAKLGARFHLMQNPVYHLYPSRSELSYHFNNKERTHALAQSAQLFCRSAVDAMVFNAFYPNRLAAVLIKSYYFCHYQLHKRLWRTVS